ncbi:MAG: NADH-quinone oxidoreductase subunit NuoH [Chloroflexota bacterium]|nr:NADH-quinone oxidoreductase subunit NuoH [Chloroflexota bacterium]
MESFNDFIANMSPWLQGLLEGIGLPEIWARVVVLGVGGFALAFVPLVAVIFLIWAARKIIARMQDRIGPNNSGPYPGPYALFQTFADAIKMLTKEDVVPAAADRWVFNIAPMVILTSAVLIWAVIPLGKGITGADLNIGIFYVLSLGSGGMIALMMAGWGSNNKYALLGALRAVANLISYEVPQVLSVIAVVMVAGSLSMQEITEAQNIPFLFVMPVTALLFFISSLAEAGRQPYDLMEADSELVAGYFVEYSGMKFGQFYLSEFINNFAISVITATLFLGGWRGPFVDSVPILGSLWLLLKSFLVFFILLWLWGSMPRLRIDQMLNFNWKFLVPVALVNICVVALVGKAVPLGADPWMRAGALLGANVLLALAVLGVLALAGRRARRRAEAQRTARMERGASTA